MKSVTIEGTTSIQRNDVAQTTLLYYMLVSWSHDHSIIWPIHWPVVNKV